MPIYPPSAVDPAVARKVRLFVGHYATEVAAELFKEGVPVRGLIVAGPHAEEATGEAEAYLSFASTYANAFTDTEGFALAWNDRSGWLLDLDFSEEAYRARTRWMADGLLPAPSRVAAFLLTAFMAPTEAGSAHRPFYRQAADPYEPLLKQLAAYHPRSAGRVGHDDWMLRFQDRRQDAYRRWLVDDLAGDAAARAISVALRPSEARALLHALELAEAHDGHVGLVGALGQDLRARIEHADVTASDPQPSRAVELARERRADRDN
jgi:hypothetical protein